MIDTWYVTVPELSGDEPRRAYVYLPTCYDSDPRRRFPVLYMFDGQNVFFDEDATYGKSWGLGSYLDYTDTPLIVAAVECNDGPNNERLSEYSPFDFRDPEFGEFEGRGEQTMRWLVQTFKPVVDATYRTLPGREATFVAGSSMGGLMSLYAVLAHNAVFSAAAALSPSLWVDLPAVRHLAQTAALEQNTSVYLDYGSLELDNHQNMAGGFAAVTADLIERGVMVTSRIVPGGDHSEASWERQVPFFMAALMYDPDGPCGDGAGPS